MIAQDGFSSDSVDVVVTILLETAQANDSVNDVVLEAALDFVGNYTIATMAIASDPNLSAENRRNSTVEFANQIASFATRISTINSSSANTGRVVAASLLEGARNLAALQEESCGTSVLDIALSASSSIHGGFLRASEFDPSNTVILIPFNEFSGLETSFQIKLSAAGPASSTHSSPCAVVAVSVIEFSDDTLFPSTAAAHTSGIASRIGSAVLSAHVSALTSQIGSTSLGQDADSLHDQVHFLGTYDFTTNLDSYPILLKSVNVYRKSSQLQYATPKCVFFDHTSAQGQWSQEGCILKTNNSTHATCSCNRFGTFAVLVSGDTLSKKHGIRIQASVYVGLGIAQVFLVLTALVVIHSLRSQPQPLQTIILLNMVLMMAAAELLFVGVTTVSLDIASCKAVSTGLLFFVLSSFAWMNVKGYHLYRLVTRDCAPDAVTEKTMLRWYGVLAMGIPLLITLAAVSDSDAMISMVDTTVVATGQVVHSDIGHCFFDNGAQVYVFFIAPIVLSVTATILLSFGVLQMRHADLENWRLLTITQDALVLLLVVVATCVNWVLAILVLDDVGGSGMQHAFAFVISLQGCCVCGLYGLWTSLNRGYHQALSSSSAWHALKHRLSRIRESEPWCKAVSPAAQKTSLKRQSTVC